MPSGVDQANQQARANLSALDHFSSFDGHRRHLTKCVLAAAPPAGYGSLCVLGAGNCFDLDLDLVGERYQSVHLVDLDASAVERAYARQKPSVSSRITLHAPVDLSGLLDRIERWAEFQVSAEELVGHAEATARRVRQQIDGPFDVVLSACMLSQMQLSVLNVLSDSHRLFDAVRWTLSLTHLRTLAELTRQSGRALFATDVTSGQLHPLDALASDADCLALVRELSEAKRVFDFADPKAIATLLSDDPVLRRAFAAFELEDAWVWTNGPETKFLVYASQLQRL